MSVQTTTTAPVVAQPTTSLWQDFRKVLRDVFGMVSSVAAGGRELGETFEDTVKLAHVEVEMLGTEQQIRMDRIKSEQQQQLKLLESA